MSAVTMDYSQLNTWGQRHEGKSLVLDGSRDHIEAPPASNALQDPDGDGVANEIPTSIVDYMEFYLLNYFKPATYEQTSAVLAGRQKFEEIGCTQCHIADLQLNHDRRIADLETNFDPVAGIFNNLFATASALYTPQDDGSGFPPLKHAANQPFLVKNIFTDFKRHDLGPNFYERNYDGTIRQKFLTTPLWGVGTTAPYGHDGRSINLKEVILRHGGEALGARDAFVALSSANQNKMMEFLNSLVLFPPDDTASNLDPGDRNAVLFPQFGHGSVKLTVLFNNPSDVEWDLDRRWEKATDQVPRLETRNLTNRFRYCVASQIRVMNFYKNREAELRMVEDSKRVAVEAVKRTLGKVGHILATSQKQSAFRWL